MKKAISVILTVILIFSSMSVLSFATYTPKAEEALKNVDLKNGASFIFINDYLEEYVEIHFIDSKTAVYLSSDLDIKMIHVDNTIYMYLTNFPFFYYETEYYGEFFPTDELLFEDLSGVEFAENYSKTVNGVTYNVEKYTNDIYEVIEFYFINDEIKIIECSYDEDYFTRLEITDEIDDKVFELPRLAINITPIINFFSNIFAL